MNVDKIRYIDMEMMAVTFGICSLDLYPPECTCIPIGRQRLWDLDKKKT